MTGTLSAGIVRPYQLAVDHPLGLTDSRVDCSRTCPRASSTVRWIPIGKKRCDEGDRSTLISHKSITVRDLQRICCSHIVNIRGNSYRMRRHTELSKAIHPTAARAVSVEHSKYTQTP